MTRILRTRLADAFNQVVSVVSSGFAYRRKPCAQCPWRVDQTGSFPAEAFRISAPTAYDMAISTFACHMSGVRKPTTCAGFLLRNADNNLAVRLKISKGDYDPSKVKAGGLDLHASYRAMAVANGCDPDDPVLASCRPNFGGDDDQ